MGQRRAFESRMIPRRNRPDRTGESPVASMPPQSGAQLLPDNVAQAAASRGLGACLIVQRGTRIGRTLGSGLVLSAALVAGIILLSLLAKVTGVRAFAWLVCPLFAGLLWVLYFTFLRARSGNSTSYLFEQGVIHTKYSKVELVTWPEVDEVWLWKAGGKTSLAGSLLNVFIVTFDGRKIPVGVQDQSGDTTFRERLLQTVASLGRPVKDSGPYTGRLRV
jgi:hypothetical protein